MNKNEKGFSVIEGLITLVIIGLIGFIGWYVWDKNSESTKQNAADPVSIQTEQLEAYEPTTTVAGDWKTYTNDKYKFSISYPANWKIDAADGNTLAESSKATDKTFFSLGFRPYSSGPMEIQYNLEVTHETLEQAVAWRKEIVRNSQVEDGDVGVRFTLTSEKYFTYDGHKAVRIDTTSDDGTPPNSYASEMYISANGLLYKFETSYHDKNALQDKDVLTVFESLKIQ